MTMKHLVRMNIGHRTQLYRRRLVEFYPICCTLHTKLAAMEQSTKHVDIHTIWLLALNNITDTAMAHKSTGYDAVWSQFENTPNHFNLIQHLGAGVEYNLAPEQVFFAFTDLTNGHT